jgi:type II secretory pathway pseudopilin PulG
MAGRRLKRDLSRLELGLALSILLVLVAVALHLMQRTMAWAERTALDTTLAELRSELDLRAATLLVRGDLQALAALARANPWPSRARTKAPPSPGRYTRQAGYLGELPGPDPTEIDGGLWYFDTVALALVYRVRHGERLTSPLPGPPRVRFTVRLEFRDVDGDRVFDPGRDEFQGVALVPLEPYGWRGAAADG